MHRQNAGKLESKGGQQADSVKTDLEGSNLELAANLENRDVDDSEFLSYLQQPAQSEAEYEPSFNFLTEYRVELNGPRRDSLQPRDTAKTTQQAQCMELLE